MANDIVFISSLISNIQYVDGSLEITKGEEFFLPVSVTQAQDTWTVGLRARRSNSAPVAEDFKRAVGSDRYVISTTTDNALPKELNFFFSLKLFFTGQSNPVTVIVAQGGLGISGNGWWMGAKQVILNSNPAGATAKVLTAFIVAGDSVYFVSSFKSNDFTYTIQPIPVS